MDHIDRRNEASRVERHGRVEFDRVERHDQVEVGRVERRGRVKVWPGVEARPSGSCSGGKARPGSRDRVIIRSWSGENLHLVEAMTRSWPVEIPR